jgi:hypothetical protein
VHGPGTRPLKKYGIAPLDEGINVKPLIVGDFS